MILGIDVGYHTTKDSTGYKFLSKYKRGDTRLNSGLLTESTVIYIDEQPYTIGEGKTVFDLNRIDSELFKASLMRVLAHKYPISEFDIVTGLPASMYNTQKDKLKEALQKMSFTKVQMGEDPAHSVHINRFLVFPQSVGAFFTVPLAGIKKSRAVMVDIGSRTIDISQFTVSEYGERHLDFTETRLLGTYEFYKPVIAEINRLTGDQSEPPENAEHYLNNGLYIGEEKNPMEFLDEMKAEHVDVIVQALASMDISFSTSDLFLTGGGAYLFEEAFKKHPRTKDIRVVPDSQFANAKGFKMVGETFWEIKSR